MATGETAMFVCEVCAYPSLKADRCDNPACLGNPSLSAAQRDRIEAEFAAYAREKAEREERQAKRARMRKAGFHTVY